MRPKRPTRVLLDQVRITREGNDAIIDHADANLSGAHITGIATMSDAEIVEKYNEILDSQWALLEAWDKTVVEEPPGEKQIDYHENSDQWVPRGEVLRCIIDDAGPNGEVISSIDDQELSLAEFGRLLSVHAGWGMRIVPEELVTEPPPILGSAWSDTEATGSTTMATSLGMAITREITLVSCLCTPQEPRLTITTLLSP